jgi:hypothetical protein
MSGNQEWNIGKILIDNTIQDVILKKNVSGESGQ